MESQKQYDAEYGKLQQGQAPPYGQPAYVPVVQGQQPKTYLVFSILNTFCCCFVFGIVSIIYSVKTREANRYGNYQEATIYSQKAKKFNIIALSVGLCIAVCYIILTVIRLYLAFYISAANENSANYTNNSN